LVEEANEALDILRGRRQKELLPHERQSPQTQAAQSNLILELREQCLHLLSLSLRGDELWCVRQLAGTLPRPARADV